MLYSYAHTFIYFHLPYPTPPTPVPLQYIPIYLHVILHSPLLLIFSFCSSLWFTPTRYLCSFIHFWQASSLDSTVCCKSPPLRGSTSLHSQTGSQPSQWDTHFGAAKRTKRDERWSVQVAYLCNKMVTCNCN